jgi:hypothetical protein
MTSVHIVPEVDSTERKLSRTLLLTVFGVLAYVLIDRVILRRHIDLTDLTTFGVIFAASSFWSDKPNSNFDLEIDSDQIRLVEQGSVKRTVSEDRIRYIREWRGNIFRRPVLVISERGAFGTRLLGGIAVPKSLPEYELIRTQALGWLTNSKT